MTTNRCDGGPAFPSDSPQMGPFAGMSLRDWFAGQALAGILTSNPKVGVKYTAAQVRQAAAEDAYAYADAMLKARGGGE